MPHISVNDQDLYYEITGEENAEDVREILVCVNGLTLDTRSWRPLSKHLKDHYKIVSYDCRGQGQSTKPDEVYTPEQHRDDLIALLDALEIQQCHLVGLSNGGLVSMLVAGEMGHERILSVSAIDSFLGVDIMFKNILASWRQATAVGGNEHKFDVALPWVWSYGYLNEHSAKVLANREHVIGTPTQPQLNLIDGLMDYTGSAKKSLRAYQGPTLAMVGQDDLLTPLRYSHEIVEWARFGMLITVDHAGHISTIEQPAAVAKMLHGFIKRREEFMTPLWSDTEE